MRDRKREAVVLGEEAVLGRRVEQATPVEAPLVFGYGSLSRRRATTTWPA